MNEIFKRVSIREFQDREVEPEKLILLLKAAMAAPSAGNQQPWEFYIVRDPENLEQLSAASPYAGCTKGAPAAIVPCARTNGLRHAAYSDIDMSAATQNLLLEAVALGLGAVWLGIAPLKERIDAVRKIIGAPKELAPFAIVPVGYPVRERLQEDRYDESRVHWA